MHRFITQSKVSKMSSTPAQIAAVAFHPRGDLFVAGLVDGQCVFYNSQTMNYMTSVKCKNRYARNKDTRITGCEFDSAGRQLLVTTNDSNIRIISMEDFTVTMKYKGTVNKKNGTIRAFFSPGDAKHIICGSQSQNVFIWRTDQNPTRLVADLDGQAQLKNDPKGQKMGLLHKSHSSGLSKLVHREEKQARRACRRKKYVCVSGLSSRVCVS